MTNLNLPPLSDDSRKELETVLDRLTKAYQDNLETLADEAADAIEYAYGRADTDLTGIMRDYARDASQQANNYYNDVRKAYENAYSYTFEDYATSSVYDPDHTLYRMVGGFNDGDWNGLNYTQLKNGQSRAGLTVNDLWPSLTNMDDAMQWAGDMVRASARYTMERNIADDPTGPRWARVTGGSKPCAFCVMLSGRGFVYHSKEKAKFGSSFHDGKCHCTVIPGWKDDVLTPGQMECKSMCDKVIQMRQDGIPQKWQREATESGVDLADSQKAISYLIRHKFPRLVKDGVLPKQRTAFHIERGFTGMRNESSLSKKGWDNRQKALGIPLDLDVLEMHEIVFAERFKKAGQHFNWIPRDVVEHTSTNDFYWKEQGYEIEVKSSRQKKPDYGAIAKNISKAVSKSSKNGTTKSSFLVDLTGYTAPEKLVHQLEQYNAKHAGNQIKHLWLFDNVGLRELTLQ